MLNVGAFWMERLSADPKTIENEHKWKDGKKEKKKKKLRKALKIAREQQCSNKSLQYIIYTARECWNTTLIIIVVNIVKSEKKTQHEKKHRR